MEFENKPIEWLDGERYQDGLNSIPDEVYFQFAGKHVALTPDGTRILASGDSYEELDSKLEEMGINVSAVVHDYFDDQPFCPLI
jgi:hypothetical protein